MPTSRNITAKRKSTADLSWHAKQSRLLNAHGAHQLDQNRIWETLTQTLKCQERMASGGNVKIIPKQPILYIFNLFCK